MLSCGETTEDTTATETPAVTTVVVPAEADSTAVEVETPVMDTMETMDTVPTEEVEVMN